MNSASCTVTSFDRNSANCIVISFARRFASCTVTSFCSELLDLYGDVIVTSLQTSLCNGLFCSTICFVCVYYEYVYSCDIAASNGITLCDIAYSRNLLEICSTTHTNLHIIIRSHAACLFLTNNHNCILI